MSPPPPMPAGRFAGFRTKLLLAMMLVVSGVTALALYLGQRSLAMSVERDLERDFHVKLGALQAAQEVRLAMLAERCRSLATRARFVAALEEAADLLYPNAEFELRDTMETPDATDRVEPALRAQFYRFLGRDGAVLPPPKPRIGGELSPAEVAQLALPAVPHRQQIGYLPRRPGDGPAAISQIVAMPIVSTESGQPLAALVLGFQSLDPGSGGLDAGMKSGIWLDGRLYGVALGTTGSPGIVEADVQRALVEPVRVSASGAPHLLFAKHLNPGSAFPPAYEVCVYPLAGLVARQRQLGWQVLGAGGLLMLIGFGASHVASSRLSAPVEKLALDSERSARFSADASHQLKTPVTVLRAGLEELLARESLKPEECDQIAALIHQTYRLSSLIEDLLLLSRMDAGRLKLDLGSVNLSQLIEASLDDLGAMPDDLQLRVETDFPAGLHIAGEKRYTAMILQNLLENARKYNRPGGRILIAARAEGGDVVLAVTNTGRPISAEARRHIFERFHRGAMGENVPGYGLGLNLARELARLHGGDLRLARSEADGTEFEVRFRLAPA